MAKLEQPSTKRVLINQANKTLVIATATAAFLVVFSLFASKALLSQRAYQAKVIGGKEKAVKQLKTNIDSVSKLVSSYQDFVSPATNVLGGISNGNGDKDGDNAKIILDALPSKYDFPALATSLEKIIKKDGSSVNGIVGKDDEVNQSQQAAQSVPLPIEMPFQLNLNASFDGVKTLISSLENSIRPFQINKLELSGADSNLTVSIDAKTYYLPEKTLNIQKEIVK